MNVLLQLTDRSLVKLLSRLDTHFRFASVNEFGSFGSTVADVYYYVLCHSVAISLKVMVLLGGESTHPLEGVSILQGRYLLVWQALP